MAGAPPSNDQLAASLAAQTQGQAPPPAPEPDPQPQGEVEALRREAASWRTRAQSAEQQAQILAGIDPGVIQALAPFIDDIRNDNVEGMLDWMERAKQSLGGGEVTATPSPSPGLPPGPLTAEQIAQMIDEKARALVDQTLSAKEQEWYREQERQDGIARMNAEIRECGLDPQSPTTAAVLRLGAAMARELQRAVTVAEALAAYKERAIADLGLGQPPVQNGTPTPPNGVPANFNPTQGMRPRDAALARLEAARRQQYV